jgi:hypothetical protein
MLYSRMSFAGLESILELEASNEDSSASSSIVFFFDNCFARTFGVLSMGRFMHALSSHAEHLCQPEAAPTIPLE